MYLIFPRLSVVLVSAPAPAQLAPDGPPAGRRSTVQGGANHHRAGAKAQVSVLGRFWSGKLWTDRKKKYILRIPHLAGCGGGAAALRAPALPARRRPRGEKATATQSRISPRAASSYLPNFQLESILSQRYLLMPSNILSGWKHKRNCATFSQVEKVHSFYIVTCCREQFTKVKRSPSFSFTHIIALQTRLRSDSSRMRERAFLAVFSPGMILAIFPAPSLISLPVFVFAEMCVCRWRPG